MEVCDLMVTIKLTPEGKVSLINGKVSCECCDPCAGLWGLGYDPWPNTVTVSCPDPGENFTATRVLKCDWVRGDLQRYVQYLKASNRWHCVGTITGGGVSGYKNGPFSAGPLGGYTLSGNVSPTPLFTVS
jgi:hypothetical protein